MIVIVRNNETTKDGVFYMVKSYNVEVKVDGNIERALRQLKKRAEREGVVRDMKRQVYFEPPTQKRRKRMMRAIKNNFLKALSTDGIDVSNMNLK